MNVVLNCRSHMLGHQTCFLRTLCTQKKFSGALALCLEWKTGRYPARPIYSRNRCARLRMSEVDREWAWASMLQLTEYGVGALNVDKTVVVQRGEVAFLVLLQRSPCSSSRMIGSSRVLWPHDAALWGIPSAVSRRAVSGSAYKQSLYD